MLNHLPQSLLAFLFAFFVVNYSVAGVDVVQENGTVSDVTLYRNQARVTRTVTLQRETESSS